MNRLNLVGKYVDSIHRLTSNPDEIREQAFDLCHTKNGIEEESMGLILKRAAQCITEICQSKH